MRAAQERGQERLPPKKRELAAAAEAERAAASGGEWAEGAAGLAAAERYGLLYKVAVPPVVSVSPLPPAFGVASPLLQHPAAGLPYPPVHYAPLPFVGAPYALPYALPPAFLPGPLLPPAAGHFVPYPSLLLEDAGLAKAAARLPLQPHHGGSPPQQGPELSSFPLQYQLAPLPAGYSAFELPAADPGAALPLQDPKLITANGGERPAMGASRSEPLDLGDSGSAEGEVPAAARHFFTDGQWLRTEGSMPSQRSTPDTDLEVQRVVGVFASQDYLPCSDPRKGGLSPLNLSHRDLPEQGEESGRHPSRAAEKNHHQRLSSAKSPEEPLYSSQILGGLAMANGKALSGSPPPTAHDSFGRGSPDAPAQGGPPDLDRAPSHFMKGAIIQLATGELKRVEDLQTQDFVRSAEVSGGLKIDSSTVVDLQESPWQGFVTLHFLVGEQQSKVSIDVPPEHPFFVYGQGWSSCSPERTARLFALPCHRLQVGDVCISISLQSLNGRLAPQGTPRERLGRASQDFREPQAGDGAGSPMQKGAVSSLLEPTSQHGWAGPSFQRFGEEPQSPLIRPSFIPQEVKVSIEGRSNAGK